MKLFGKKPKTDLMLDVYENGTDYSSNLHTNPHGLPAVSNEDIIDAQIALGECPGFLLTGARKSLLPTARL